MDSTLLEVWQTASGSPFLPAVGKENQFLVGFSLVLVGLSLAGGFALSEQHAPRPLRSPNSADFCAFKTGPLSTSPSSASLPLWRSRTSCRALSGVRSRATAS